MSGTVKHARLDSQSARARLKCGRQPHWQALVEGRVHLGWQRSKGKQGKAGGRWLLRRYVGNNKYRVQTLGRADDVAPADGIRMLSHEQAEAKARAMVGSPENGPIVRMTVRQAMARYIDYKQHQGQPVRDLNTVNGIRITVEDGTWGLVRASSNKPELVVVVESPVSEARMRDMFKALDAVLRTHKEVGEYNQTI